MSEIEDEYESLKRASRRGMRRMRLAFSRPGRALHLVLEELKRAREKFPNQHLPQGTGPRVTPFGEVCLGGHGLFTAHLAHVTAKAKCQDPRIPDTWLQVITEEWGEYADTDPADREALKAELSQVAAVALRALEDVLRAEDEEEAEALG